ncbi:transducin family protein/WD-40 repeat protein [Spatholobus suberectus]|nr:transducin family protein/WD-40 repeat protein [Spatholobus suberectus]
MASNPRKGLVLRSKAIADAASWYCAFVLVALVLLSMFKDSSMLPNRSNNFVDSQLLSRPCDEIYVVGEGETLHTISDKCGDPFIVENNPHIHDPDDVFHGLVIKITPSHQT